MNRIKQLCPNFVEVQSDQPEQIRQNGFPVDIVPIRNLRGFEGELGEDRPRMQSFMQCCVNNIMAPLHEATLGLGATLIIRGQKDADSLKGKLRSGDVVDGVEYWYPIQDWTDAETIEYVWKLGYLPEHYDYANTSLDCWSCTAFLEENQWKQQYLADKHPEWAGVVKNRLTIIRHEVERDFIWLKRLG